jgi:hypothetical protein
MNKLLLRLGKIDVKYVDIESFRNLRKKLLSPYYSEKSKPIYAVSAEGFVASYSYSYNLPHWVTERLLLSLRSCVCLFV